MSRKNHKKRFIGKNEVNTAAREKDSSNSQSELKAEQTGTDDSENLNDNSEKLNDNSQITEEPDTDNSEDQTANTEEEVGNTMADVQAALSASIAEMLRDDDDEKVSEDKPSVQKNVSDKENTSKKDHKKNMKALKQDDSSAEKSDSSAEKSNSPAEENDRSSEKNKQSAKENAENIKVTAAKTSEERRKLVADNERAKEIDERRALRHSRRIRNQVISYVVVALVVIFIGVGAYFCINKFILNKKNNADNTSKEDVAVTEMTDEIVNDLIGDETEIEEPVVEEVENTEEPVVEETDPLDEYVAEIIASMTLEEKVAGLFITTPESITGVNLATIAGDGTQKALEEYAVGGIVYSQKNIVDMNQFSTMVSKTLEMAKYRPFIAIAEEGGDVSPLASAGYYDKQLSASELAASGDVTNAYSAGVTIGLAMNNIGLNLDLAPVADISSVSGNILGNRCFADTAIGASDYVNSYFSGIEACGVTACLKSFPGLGCVTSDPASGRVVCDRSQDDFASGELLVYQSAIENGANMIMMSNAIYSAYDDSAPASLSDSVVGTLLRNQLGYDGIILSGNLSDAAVSDYYGADEAAIQALKAGCDMLLCPEDFSKAYEGIINAVNDNSLDERRIDEALTRIFRVKYADEVAADTVSEDAANTDSEDADTVKADE